MSLPLLERSTYYRGLLVLIGKDRIVDPRERELMIRIGGLLDFDTRFCEAAIESLLNNPHLTAEPMTFSLRRTVECFLRDGLRVALCDGEIHAREQAWLKTVAEANGLPGEWLDAEIQQILKDDDTLDRSSPLAIQQHL